MISFTICMCKPYIVGGGRKFSGGFDVNVFMEVHKTRDVSLLPDESIDLLVNTIGDAGKPSVAVIQGLTLGECHARISTPNAQFGLLKLTLGVIHGFGGTQRIHRLVGLSKAIEMMLRYKSIRAKEGKDCGLVEAIVSPENLLMVARSWALEIANGRQNRVRRSHPGTTTPLLFPDKEGGAPRYPSPRPRARPPRSGGFLATLPGWPPSYQGWAALCLPAPSRGSTGRWAASSSPDRHFRRAASWFLQERTRLFHKFSICVPPFQTFLFVRLSHNGANHQAKWPLNTLDEKGRRLLYEAKEEAPGSAIATPSSRNESPHTKAGCHRESPPPLCAPPPNRRQAPQEKEIHHLVFGFECSSVCRRGNSLN
ncbi:Peroxisomal fatty acid beta-oxidation multifunctional protein [Platanthera guangdongensis]|uniref:Peroxisomal fatty acid beta-oxidation multifunctional protein n=1 Tax=Platanthera guangdongensis TaxID=2320717 RepID=A0ABR2LLR4_9ASPA